MLLFQYTEREPTRGKHQSTVLHVTCLAVLLGKLSSHTSAVSKVVHMMISEAILN